MADFSAIKAQIDAKIYDNTSQAITGQALNDVLQGMVDAVNQLKGDNVPVVEISDIPSGGLLPDVYYVKLGGLLGNVTLADAPDDGKSHIYMLQFTASGYQINWDEKIIAWFGGVAPNVTDGEHQLFVVDGLGIIGVFE